MNWQSIDTAPKDGTKLLAVTSFAGERGIFIIRWDSRIPSWILDCFGCNIAVSPTLWMPLPEPPQREGVTNDNRQNPS